MPSTPRLSKQIRAEITSAWPDGPDGLASARAFNDLVAELLCHPDLATRWAEFDRLGNRLVADALTLGYCLARTRRPGRHRVAWYQAALELADLAPKTTRSTEE